MGEMAEKQSGAAVFTTGTPAKIIEAAEQLFWHQGYKATSIDDIVSRAGQSKGAFFHYFSSKNEVTGYALSKYAQEEIFAPMQSHFAGSLSIKGALRAWMKGFYDTQGAKGYKGGCMLGNMALELSDRDEEVRGVLSGIFLEWENALVNLLKDEGRSGRLQMEPRQFARLVISSLQGVLMGIKVHKDPRRATRDFQALAQLFDHMITD